MILDRKYAIIAGIVDGVLAAAVIVSLGFIQSFAGRISDLETRLSTIETRSDEDHSQINTLGGTVGQIVTFLNQAVQQSQEPTLNK